MNILGVTLREISLKREDVKGPVNIKKIDNNINIVGLKQETVPMAESGEALIFSFEYVCNYELGGNKGTFGTMTFAGDVVFTDTKKAMKDALKSWDKDKKLDNDVLVPVLQAAFNKVNIEAIGLAGKVMLPSPIQLPKINPPKK